MPRRQVPCQGCGKLRNVGRGSLPIPICHECRRKNSKRQLAIAATCPTCGDEFSRSYPATYCSRACANNRSGADHGPRACEWCAGIFVPRDHGENERQRFCSYDCTRLAQRRRWPSSRIYIKTCEECTRLFVARTSHRRLCGDECSRKRNSRKISQGIMRRYHSDPEFRDLLLSKAQNRRASLLGQEGITSPKALIAYLMKRDRGRCGKCHQLIKATTGPRRPSIGHIIPLARGGEHVLENVQAEHLDCNLRAGARDDGGQILLVG